MKVCSTYRKNSGSSGQGQPSLLDLPRSLLPTHGPLPSAVRSPPPAQQAGGWPRRRQQPLAAPPAPPAGRRGSPPPLPSIPPPPSPPPSRLVRGWRRQRVRGGLKLRSQRPRRSDVRGCRHRDVATAPGALEGLGGLDDGIQVGACRVQLALLICGRAAGRAGPSPPPRRGPCRCRRAPRRGRRGDGRALHAPRGKHEGGGGEVSPLRPSLTLAAGAPPCGPSAVPAPSQGLPTSGPVVAGRAKGGGRQARSGWSTRKDAGRLKAAAPPPERVPLTASGRGRPAAPPAAAAHTEGRAPT